MNATQFIANLSAMTGTCAACDLCLRTESDVCNNSLTLKEVGLGSLNGAVMNRLACESDGGFFTSDASYTEARTGEPQGSPVLHRSANPVSGFHPLGRGSEVTKPLLEHHMEQSVTTGISATVSPVSQTMSSLEIAKLTDKQHRNVLADIRKTLEEAEIDAAEFSAAQPYGKNGNTREVFNLPRLECDLVISGYSVKYRLAIIKRWHELEAKIAAPAIPYAVLPGQTLSAAQAATIRDMLTDACKALAKDLQAMFMTQGWSKLKTHFGTTYRQIPAHEFEEAVSLVSRHIEFFEGTKVLPAPSTNAPSLDVNTLTAMIKGGMIDPRALISLAESATEKLFTDAASNPNRGYGQEVARKINANMSWSDLHAINQQASMEVYLRTFGISRDVPQIGRAA